VYSVSRVELALKRTLGALLRHTLRFDRCPLGLVLPADAAGLHKATTKVHFLVIIVLVAASNLVSRVNKRPRTAANLVSRAKKNLL